MSHFSSEDEALLQSMLRQLLQSVKEKITGAPSVECAEEILLHLEETDENFHNYEFVKYLRQYINNTLGSVIEEETDRCTSAQNQGEGSGYDTLVQHVTKKTRESKEYREMMHSLKNVIMVVVESLINKFEEDQMRYKEMQRKVRTEQHSSYYADNCSDSDSSFNQSYTFMNQEQLQLLVERLDPAQPKEVRQEAMQTLCSAPPSDILNCESWTNLHKHLATALSDPDSNFSDKVLKFYAKTFSSSPLNMTKELYTSLANYLELYFLSENNYVPTLSTGIDITNPDVIRLLKKIRLLNDYQREVPSFWIRHPEKYMEEIMESTLSLLSLKHELSHVVSTEYLDPVCFLALVDIKAVWFKKWMHAYYSRTVVLRLLEKRYKSLVSLWLSKEKNLYSGKELQYIHFVHSVSLLGRLLIYKQGRKLFPVQLRNGKDLMSLTDLVIMFIRLIYYSPKAVTIHLGNYSPAGLITDVLRILCDRKECATECLYTNAVIEALLQPLHDLLSGTEVHLNYLETTLIHIADILARIAATDDGLSLLLYGGEKSAVEGNSCRGAHTIVQFTKKLLDEDISVLPGSEMLPVLKGAFIFVCHQMYSTCEGLEVLLPYHLHESIAKAWKKTSLLSERIPTPVAGADCVSTVSQESQNFIVLEETLLDDLLSFAATPKGLLLLQSTGTVNECITFMFNRFTKNFQVNGCEKFGYGVIVSQVAATASGAVALQSSGFIKALVTELWSVLECGRDDVRVTQPKSTPVDPIDRSCQKPFLALINLLSYPAVYELIGDQEIPNKPVYSLREVPTDIIDIVDRLIIVNTEAKIHSLFNYEQSHIFGLSYGNHLDLLRENAEKDLCQVLMYCDKYLRQQQALLTTSLRSLQGGYTSYDWFASSVFLIMKGDREKTLRFLHQFSHLLVSAFLWIPRLHCSIHLPDSTAVSGIHPVYYCSAHYVEMLLKAELPLVSSAFRMSGFTSSQVCQQWLTQCFWNYMDWSEICHYIAICIFLGPDYQIYMCISVFKHLQQEILQHTQTQDLQVYLKEEAFHGFQVSDYFRYMENLALTYRPVLLGDMRNIRVQNT
uniref:Protein broad-minded n=1 Tax=Varanus komodoensis TaxID=61221 RepID=A0A8D2JCN3_VARKO